MTSDYPTFGGTWSDDPEIRAQQDEVARLHAKRQWRCGTCGCIKVCRQAVRLAWLWRKTQRIETERREQVSQR